MSLSQPGIPLSSQQAYHANGYSTQGHQTPTRTQDIAFPSSSAPTLPRPLLIGVQTPEGRDILMDNGDPVRQAASPPRTSQSSATTLQPGANGPQTATSTRSISQPAMAAAPVSSLPTYRNTQLFKGLRFFLPPQVYTPRARAAIHFLIELHGGIIIHLFQPTRTFEWTVYPRQDEMPPEARATTIIFHRIPGSQMTFTPLIHGSLYSERLQLEWRGGAGLGSIVPIALPTRGRSLYMPHQSTGAQQEQASLAPISNARITHPPTWSNVKVLDRVRSAIAQWDWQGKTIGDFERYHIQQIPNIVLVMRENIGLLCKEFISIRTRVEASQEKRATQVMENGRQTQSTASTLSRAGSAEITSIRSSSQGPSPAVTPKRNRVHEALPPTVAFSRNTQAGSMGSHVVPHSATQMPRATNNESKTPPPTPEEWHILSNLSIPGLLQQHRQQTSEFQSTKRQLATEVHGRRAVEGQLKFLQAGQVCASQANAALSTRLMEATGKLVKAHQVSAGERQYWTRMFEEETKRMGEMTRKIVEGPYIGLEDDTMMGSTDEVVRQAEAAMEEAKKAIERAEAIVVNGVYCVEAIQDDDRAGEPVEVTLG